MRLATIRTGTTTTAAKILGDSRAVALNAPDVGTLLRDGGYDEGEEFTFSPTDFAPLIPRPGKIICVGLNYAKHIREMGHEQPDVPTLFIKFPEALIGAYDDAEVPAFNAQSLDYEGELAVIVGKRARHVSNGAEYIAGYSIINDYTQRGYQYRTQQWHQGKSLEKTAGFGPWLDTDWQPGPALTTTLNGERVQHSLTNDLVFTPAALVEFISHLYPLEPGDVIATGTPDGVGHAREPKRYLTNGDTVRVEIDGLGAIENTTRIY